KCLSLCEPYAGADPAQRRHIRRIEQLRVRHDLEIHSRSDNIRTTTGRRAMDWTRIVRNSISAGLAILFSACGVNAVVVEGSYPTPNIRPFPMTLGVYFDDELKNYTYIEY